VTAVARDPDRARESWPAFSARARGVAIGGRGEALARATTVVNATPLDGEPRRSISTAWARARW